MIKIELVLYEKDNIVKPSYRGEVSLPIVPRTGDLISFQNQSYRVNEIKLYANLDKISVLAISILTIV